jgi:hypothetical protein
MGTGFLINLGLALHLTGLSIAIGVVLTKYLSFKKVFSERAVDHRKWAFTLWATVRLNAYLGIGMGVAILSGAFMMYLAYAAFMYQLWFQVKIGILLIIIISGIVTTRNESKLRKLLANGETLYDNLYTRLTSVIKFATGLQFILFIVVIILASFRFT